MVWKILCIQLLKSMDFFCLEVWIFFLLTKKKNGILFLPCQLATKLSLDNLLAQYKKDISPTKLCSLSMNPAAWKSLGFSKGILPSILPLQKFAAKMGLKRN